MRALLAALLLLGSLSAALPQAGYPAGPLPSATGQAATGQIPGTATNDSASAGNVGQILTATASSVAVLNVTAKTITSQSLTAGDWDVWCTFNFTPAAGTTVNIVQGEVSTTDNTSPSTLGNYHKFSFETASAAGASAIAFGTPQVPASLSGTTPYYCVAFSQFGVSTMGVDAKLVARRRR